MREKNNICVTIFIVLFSDSTLQEAGYTTWGSGEPVVDAEYGFFKINTGLGMSTCNQSSYFICESEC